MATDTKGDLVKMRAVVDGATEGPWEPVPDPRGSDYPVIDIQTVGDDGQYLGLVMSGADHICPEDMRFITTFDPPTVRELLDRLELAAKLAWLLRTSPELNNVWLSKSKDPRDDSESSAMGVLNNMLDTLTGIMDRSQNIIMEVLVGMPGWMGYRVRFSA